MPTATPHQASPSSSLASQSTVRRDGVDITSWIEQTYEEGTGVDQATLSSSSPTSKQQANASPSSPRHPTTVRRPRASYFLPKTVSFGDFGAAGSPSGRVDLGVPQAPQVVQAKPLKSAMKSTTSTKWGVETGVQSLPSASIENDEDVDMDISDCWASQQSIGTFETTTSHHSGMDHTQESGCAEAMDDGTETESVCSVRESEPKQPATPLVARDTIVEGHHPISIEGRPLFAGFKMGTRTTGSGASLTRADSIALTRTLSQKGMSLLKAIQDDSRDDPKAAKSMGLAASLAPVHESNMEVDGPVTPPRPTKPFTPHGPRPSVRTAPTPTSTPIKPLVFPKPVRPNTAYRARPLGPTKTFFPPEAGPEFYLPFARKMELPVRLERWDYVGELSEYFNRFYAFFERHRFNITSDDRTQVYTFIKFCLAEIDALGAEHERDEGWMGYKEAMKNGQLVSRWTQFRLDTKGLDTCIIDTTA